MVPESGARLQTSNLVLIFSHSEKPESLRTSKIMSSSKQPFQTMWSDWRIPCTLFYELHIAMHVTVTICTIECRTDLMHDVPNRFG